MNDLRKAAGEALEALEDVPYMSNKDDYERLERVKTALRQALETEQEPVAWMYVNYDGECEQIEYGPVFDDPDVTPLYTAPPKQWVGLREDEIFSILENLQTIYNRPPTKDNRIIFAQAIEAKLKEKNHG